MRAKDLTPMQGQQLIEKAKTEAMQTANERQEPVAAGTMIEKLYEGVLGQPLTQFAKVNGWPMVSDTTWQTIALELLELVQFDAAFEREMSESEAYRRALLVWMNYGFSCTAHNPEAPQLPDYAIYGGEIEVEWQQ